MFSRQGFSPKPEERLLAAERTTRYTGGSDLAEMMMATKVPNAIINDNASYTLIVSPPTLGKWETDHRTISERYYST